MARNRGLKEAKGTYIKFLDDDDWLQAGALMKEFELLESKKLNLLLGNCKHAGTNGNNIRTSTNDWEGDLIIAFFRDQLVTYTMTITYKRNFLIRNNIDWNQNLQARQDIDILRAVILKEPRYVIANFISGYMRHHEGLRVSTSAGKKYDTIKIHADLFCEMLKVLEVTSQLTPERKIAAAEGLWKWAHMMAGYNLSSFTKLYKKIFDLNKSFRPDRKQKINTLLDAAISPYGTEILSYPFRLVKKLITQ